MTLFPTVPGQDDQRQDLEIRLVAQAQRIVVIHVHVGERQIQLKRETKARSITTSSFCGRIVTAWRAASKR